MAENADSTSDDAVSWKDWWTVIVIANVVFMILEYLVFRDLGRLESGEAENASVWAPVAMVYESFGLGAAMSVVPALWLFCIGIMAWQTWSRIQRERQRSATSDTGISSDRDENSST